MAMPHDLRDLNSPTRIELRALTVKARSPNNWTTSRIL